MNAYIEPAFTYKGTDLHEDPDYQPEAGDVTTSSVTGGTFIYDGVDWDCLFENSMTIKTTKCPGCGASLPIEEAVDGACKCKYCRQWITIY